MPRATAPCPHCGTLNRIDLSRIADRPKCGACGRPILLDRPVRIAGSRFDKVVAGTSVPVLVDFFADWCGPCHAMAPALDEVAGARAGRTLVLQVDTDRDPALAARYRIQALPTFVVLQDGAEVGRQTGAVGRPALEELIERVTRST